MGTARIDLEVLERGIDALERTITETTDLVLQQLDEGAADVLVADDLVAVAESTAELERRWHHLPATSARRDTILRVEANLDRLVAGAASVGRLSAIPSFVHGRLADLDLSAARWRVGQSIRTARLGRNLSIRALARQVKIGSGYLSELESAKAGAFPSPEVSRRLDDALATAIQMEVATFRARHERLVASERVLTPTPTLFRQGEALDSDLRVELIRRAVRQDAALLDLVEYVVRLPVHVRRAVGDLARALQETGD
jgi:transcriptional regulator with XRE-family HTH domain